MANAWGQFIHKKWLLGLNVIIACFIFLAILGYQPAGRLPGIIRWPDIRNYQVEKNILTCYPKTNIFFLKTHKCASSSVQNILLRHAHRKNLTVAMPVDTKSHKFSLVKPFRREMITGAPWQEFGYNIMCHHMVFSESEVEKIMPSDTIYISIVREPVSLFESFYEYLKLEDYYKMNIEEYAKATTNSSLIGKLKVRANGMGRNPMLYDFGINPRLFNNKKAIEDYVKQLNKRFDFVMIAEFFDESIVILRHILCWELDDVISLTINARMKSYKKTLSDEASKNLRKWNSGDQVLYLFFLKKFKKAMEEFGQERLEKEVKELRERRQQWFEKCVDEEVESKNLTSYKIWSSKVTGFKIKSNNTNENCADLVKPEKYFTNELRQHQLIRSIEKGPSKPMSLYRMLDLSKLKGKELENARKVLREYIKQKRLKSPLLRLRTNKKT